MMASLAYSDGGNIQVPTAMQDSLQVNTRALLHSVDKRATISSASNSLVVSKTVSLSRRVVQELPVPVPPVDMKCDTCGGLFASGLPKGTAIKKASCGK